MLFRNADIIRLDSVDSTNNYAANLLKLSRVPEGTVITTLEQTNGRGQRGTHWSSNKGENLLCSYILYPQNIRQGSQFLISQMVALAVQEFLEDLTHSDVHIKWPNDLIIKDQKVAGILIETNWSEGKVQNCIIGIGININQQEFENERALSIGKASAKYFVVDECLEKLSATLEKYYLRLCKGQEQAIRAEYIDNLYNLNVEKEYVALGQKFVAKIVGVEHSGLLCLQEMNGVNRLFDFKEVALVW